MSTVFSLEKEYIKLCEEKKVVPKLTEFREAEKYVKESARAVINTGKICLISREIDRFFCYVVLINENCAVPSIHEL